MRIKIVLLFALLMCILFFGYTAQCQHDEYLNEQRGSIVDAIKNKPDLMGLSKDAVRGRFGYPVNISVDKEGSVGEQEVWVYRPYELGSYRLTVKFKNDKVVNYEYREHDKEKLNDKKDNHDPFSQD